MQTIGDGQFCFVSQRFMAGCFAPSERQQMNMQPSKPGWMRHSHMVKTGLRSAALGLAVAVLAGGCASKAPLPDPIREPVQRLLPRLTEAVTGPAAGLLTNLNGYHAHFTIDFGSNGMEELTASGDLQSRDGKLCFEPVFKQGKHKGVDAGGFILIWDTAGKSGFVLSDALQGFAPVGPAFGTTYTNISALRVEQAKDLNGLATRIEWSDPARPFTMTLSDIKPGPPPPDIFVPPDGFTKYDSEGVLLGELAARQRAVMGANRKQSEDLEPNTPEPSPQPPSTGNGVGY
jgi:hypothetical protein